MNTYRRFKKWLADLTSIPFVANSVLKDQLHDLKMVGQLVSHTTFWKSKYKWPHDLITSPGLICQLLRPMANTSQATTIDAYSPIRLEFCENLPSLNVSLYTVSLSGSPESRTILPCKVVVNYDERRLYLVTNDLLESCLGTFLLSKVRTFVKPTV